MAWLGLGLTTLLPTFTWIQDSLFDSRGAPAPLAVFGPPLKDLLLKDVGALLWSAAPAQ
jgi:hypothetical protein